MPFPYVRFSDFRYEKQIQWGDVYWFDFGAVRSNQDRTMADAHLAIVVSNPMITLKGAVLLMPLSGAAHRMKQYQFHVLITKQECPKLDKDSFAQADRVYCVTDKNNLPDQYYLTHLNAAIMKRVYDQLLRVLNVEQMMKALSTS